MIIIMCVCGFQVPPMIILGWESTTNAYQPQHWNSGVMRLCCIHCGYLAPLFERVGDVDSVVRVMLMYLGDLLVCQRAR